MKPLSSVVAFALFVFNSCSHGTAEPPASDLDPVLSARAGIPTITAPAGKTKFTVGASSAVVYVPESITPGEPVGLVVFLHGALRTVDVFVDAHKPLADAANVIVLAPYALSGTWDAIHTRFAADPAIIDSAMSWVFQRWRIDPARIAMSGFSDGGTYALAIGRRNGDLFSQVAAYSPGFLLPVKENGRPPILISHGTADEVLPINSTSRVIVPQLRQRGYTVDYREYPGPHAVFAAAVEDLVRSVGR